jgi:tetratricopeptide (TPR) repeat protein
MTIDRLHRCGHDLDNYEPMEINGFVRWADPVCSSPANGKSNKELDTVSPLSDETFLVTPTNYTMSASNSSDSVGEAGRLFRFAETLRAEGDYDRAITEYRRLLFYFPDSEFQNSAFKAIFYCYYESQNYLTAIHWGQDILARGMNSIEDNELRLFLGASYFKLGNFSLARNYFAEVISTDEGVFREKSYLLQGLAFAKEAHWDYAQKCFAGVTSDSELYEAAQECAKLAQEGKKLTLKNPTAAGILAIIPGLGYLYDGYEQTALAAFIVNGLFIWATVEAFRKDNESLGTMLSVLSFGWYAGNVYGSVLSAHRRNIKLKNDLLVKFDVGFKF